MKKSEQLGQQLEQEQQLRSVAESCLMENRMTWQNVHRLATETRAQCTALHSIAERVRYAFLHLTFCSCLFSLKTCSLTLKLVLVYNILLR